MTLCSVLRDGLGRIGGAVRHRAMPTAAAEDDGPAVDIGQHRPRAQPEAAERQAGLVVQPEDGVGGEAVEQPFLDHDAAAAEQLLGGLEDEVDGAGKIRVLRQVARGAEQHRGVPVMAAGMHDPWRGRGVGGAGGFQDRQRIHVGAQRDGAAPLAPAAQRADHAGACDAFCNLDPPAPQLRRDQPGGAAFLEAELGVAVQVVPDGGQLGLMAREQRDQVGCHEGLTTASCECVLLASCARRK
jgi:hypothetical protein